MNTDWNSVYRNKPYVEKKPHQGLVDFLEQLDLEKNSRILDLGCGDGRHLIYLARQGFIPLGMDNAFWGLLRAKEWALKEKLNIHFLSADVGSLPLAAESFELVISIQVIHHQKTEEIQKTLDGVRSLLRPGGYFFFTVPKFPPGSWKEGNYTEPEPHTYAPLEGFEHGIPHHFFTPQELALMLKDFEILEIGDDSGRHLKALVRKRE